MINIKEINQKLPHGAQKAIAERAKVKPQLVCDVLAGRSKSIAVLDAIADYLLEQKQQEEQIQKKFNQLYNQK